MLRLSKQALTFRFIFVPVKASFDASFHFRAYIKQTMIALKLSSKHAS